MTMLLAAIRDLAELYAKYQPEATDAQYIEADIHNLYMYDNMSEAFPYLNGLSSEDFCRENKYIFEFRFTIADFLTN